MSKCILHKNLGANGYGRVYSPENKTTMFAHRKAYIEAYGPIPKGMCVCHKCDVRNCINPDHLFLGTHQENIADMLKKNRHYAGCKQKTAHIKTPQDVLDIRASDLPHKIIAKKYNTNYEVIRKIRKKLSYKNV